MTDAERNAKYVATYLWDDGSGPAHFEPLEAMELDAALAEASGKVPSNRRLQRIYDQSKREHETVWQRRPARWGE